MGGMRVAEQGRREQGSLHGDTCHHDLTVPRLMTLARGRQTCAASPSEGQKYPRLPLSSHNASSLSSSSCLAFISPFSHHSFSLSFLLLLSCLLFLLMLLLFFPFLLLLPAFKNKLYVIKTQHIVTVSQRTYAAATNVYIAPPVSHSHTFLLLPLLLLLLLLLLILFTLLFLVGTPHIDKQQENKL